MPKADLWVLGSLCLVGIVLLICAALPSHECTHHGHCLGDASVCVDQYCDCDDFEGYRCGATHPGSWYHGYYYPYYQTHRGYGNGYSVVVLVIVLCFAVWGIWACRLDDTPRPQPEAARRTFVIATPSVGRYGFV